MPRTCLVKHCWGRSEGLSIGYGFFISHIYLDELTKDQQWSTFLYWWNWAGRSKLLMSMNLISKCKPPRNVIILWEERCLKLTFNFPPHARSALPISFVQCHRKRSGLARGTLSPGGKQSGIFSLFLKFVGFFNVCSYIGMLSPSTPQQTMSSRKPDVHHIF